MSANQIQKLGDRLRSSDPPHVEDITALETLLLDYRAPMEEVSRRLRDELGLEPTPRLKTETTIIQKLRRFKTNLARMQDLAGVRVVRSMTLDEQDRLVARIVELFACDAGRDVDDRRARPSWGYRAVHVVPIVDGCPVEIQVRTEIQDLWAQMIERLADMWGRGIRYGDGPEDPDLVEMEVDGESWTRTTIVQQQIHHSDLLAQVEAGIAKLGSLRLAAAELGDKVGGDLLQEIAQLDAEIEQRIGALRRAYLAFLRPASGPNAGAGATGTPAED